MPDAIKDIKVKHTSEHVARDILFVLWIF